MQKYFLKNYEKNNKVIKVTTAVITLFVVLFSYIANAGNQPQISNGNRSKVGFNNQYANSPGPVNTSEWSLAEVDRFPINAENPPFMDGEYIDELLSRYSGSPLIGYGDEILKASEKYGISAGFALGIWAKETTFGTDPTLGSQHYNFGGMIAETDPNYDSVFIRDRRWVSYPDVKTGIDRWFNYAKNRYLDQGIVTYKDFLDIYSPTSDNNKHDEFKNIMSGILKAVGYDLGVEPEIDVSPGYVNLTEENTEDIGESGLPSSEGLNVKMEGDFFYPGAAKGQYGAKQNLLGRIIEGFSEILDYLAGIFISVLIKLPLIGYASLVEVLMTTTLEAISGQEVYVTRETNIDLYVDPRRAVNVENIIFGRIELLNVDFFIAPEVISERTEGLTATGQEIENINNRARIAGSEGASSEYDESQDIIEYEQSTPGLIRTYYAAIYYSVFGLVIVFMLITLIIAVIAYLVTTISQKKADIKVFLLEWIKTFLTIFLSLIYVIFIIKLNSYLIKIFYATLETDTFNQTFSMYETIRTRAYDMRFTVGVPAAIIYFILVWYTVRFLFIYFKRLIAVLITSATGPLVNLYQLIISTLKGAPQDTSLTTNWMKEFTGLVLIQTIHVFIYVLIIPMVMELTKDGIIGFIIALVLLRAMLKMSGYIREALSMEGKPGILKNVLDKSNPAQGAEKLMKGAVGFQIAGVPVIKTIYGKAEEGVKQVVKKVNEGAGALGRGAYNLGSFIGDYTYNKYNKTISEKYFDPIKARVNNIRLSPEKRKQKEKLKNQIYLKLKAANLTPENYQGILESASISDLKKLANLEEDELELKIKNLDNKYFKKDVRHARFAKFTKAFSEFKKGEHGLATLDENGNYRILAPQKEYNPETGKFEVTSKASKKAIDELAKNLGIDTKDYSKKTKDVLKTLKNGLGFYGSLMLMPIIFTDPGIGTWLMLKTGTPGENFREVRDTYRKYRPAKKFRLSKAKYKYMGRYYFNGISRNTVQKTIKEAKKVIENHQIDVMDNTLPVMENKPFKLSLPFEAKKYTTRTRKLKKLKDRRREENQALRDYRDLEAKLFKEELISIQSKQISHYLNKYDGDASLTNAAARFSPINVIGLENNIKEAIKKQEVIIGIADIQKDKEKSIQDVRKQRLSPKETNIEIEKINDKYLDDALYYGRNNGLKDLQIIALSTENSNIIEGLAENVNAEIINDYSQLMIEDLGHMKIADLLSGDVIDSRIKEKDKTIGIATQDIVQKMVSASVLEELMAVVDEEAKALVAENIGYEEFEEARQGEEATRKQLEAILIKQIKEDKTKDAKTTKKEIKELKENLQNINIYEHKDINLVKLTKKMKKGKKVRKQIEDTKQKLYEQDVETVVEDNKDRTYEMLKMMNDTNDVYDEILERRDEDRIVYGEISEPTEVEDMIEIKQAVRAGRPARLNHPDKYDQKTGKYNVTTVRKKARRKNQYEEIVDKQKKEKEIKKETQKEEEQKDMSDAEKKAEQSKNKREEQIKNIQDILKRFS